MTRFMFMFLVCRLTFHVDCNRLFLYILLRPMFYLMHEGQIGLGSNAKLISFLSNIQSEHSLIEYKEIQLFLNVINGNNEFTLKQH